MSIHLFLMWAPSLDFEQLILSKQCAKLIADIVFRVCLQVTSSKLVAAFISRKKMGLSENGAHTQNVTFNRKDDD